MPLAYYLSMPSQEYTLLKDIERAIRSSAEYAQWVARNAGTHCIKCDAITSLQCHHVITLYHIILGLWQLYGDKDEVVKHAISLHTADKVENVTLCDNCHNKSHPGRRLAQPKPINITGWAVIPRNMEAKLCHSKAKPQGTLGLIGLQTLLGIGMHILVGHMSGRIMHIHRRRFADLLGKTAGTSFNRSLDMALGDLTYLNVLAGWHSGGNDIELHLTEEYLNSLAMSPWFMPVNDIRASRACSLALQLWLGMQSNRKTYKIGLDKLCKHIGITVKSPSMAAKAIRAGCEEILWLKVEVEKGMCRFEICRRGATPIFSLRQTLDDSIQHGR